MRKYTVILLLVCCTYIQGQQTKKINYQIDFGTTYSIPFEDRIVKASNHWVTAFYNSSFGVFLDFSMIYNFNNYISLSSGMIFYQNRLEIFRRHSHGFRFRSAHHAGHSRHSGKTGRALRGENHFRPSHPGRHP